MNHYATILLFFKAFCEQSNLSFTFVGNGVLKIFTLFDNSPAEGKRKELITSSFLDDDTSELKSFVLMMLIMNLSDVRYGDKPEDIKKHNFRTIIVSEFDNSVVSKMYVRFIPEADHPLDNTKIDVSFNDVVTYEYEDIKQLIKSQIEIMNLYRIVF